ncbi:Uncharacterized protein, contains metal-binding DGC domain [Formivibrio citricus]|uniref:Uncharacterized protein, contains metal-binding DGC domain n=1 Tax=Formivibrio citricus TaxID=83765 RepID=A0A1I4WIZ4_9NEIS|nr:putative zinc-binding protein [Formivibrio citricus]SFN13250.1 Uncharacterized protein, contains metal-binding DGC domain [Formivibrio citricus]
MSEAASCSCSVGPRLIFACSGAADVGEVADRAARQLSRSGVGQMYCLSAVASGNPAPLEKTRAASAILAIDACPAACASMVLKKAGFTDFQRVQLAELGLEKGCSPATQENIDSVVAAARRVLQP